MYVTVNICGRVVHKRQYVRKADTLGGRALVAVMQLVSGKKVAKEHVHRYDGVSLYPHFPAHIKFFVRCHAWRRLSDWREILPHVKRVLYVRGLWVAFISVRGFGQISASWGKSACERVHERAGVRPKSACSQHV